MNRWYVVHTHVQAEEKAAFHLRRQGYKVYLPHCLKRVRHARRTEYKPSPLFPRYLFVEFDVETCRWLSVMSTVGVSHLISTAVGPVPLPEGVVDGIRARQDGDGFIPLKKLQPLRAGETVTLNEGPFEGYTAIFECPNDDDRVTLLMTIMGREMRIRVPGCSIAA